MELRRTDAFDRRLRGIADPNAKARINVAVQRMADGNFGDSKAVGGGVIETRVHYGPGYRIYFARRGAIVIVLLLCGAKTTQRADIVAAQSMVAQL